MVLFTVGNANHLPHHRRERLIPVDETGLRATLWRCAGAAGLLEA